LVDLFDLKLGWIGGTGGYLENQQHCVVTVMFYLFDYVVINTSINFLSQSDLV